MAFGNKPKKGSTPQPDTSPDEGRGFFGRKQRHPASKAVIPPLDDDEAWRGVGNNVHDWNRGPFKDDQGGIHF